MLNLNLSTRLRIPNIVLGRINILSSTLFLLLIACSVAIVMAYRRWFMEHAKGF